MCIEVLDSRWTAAKPSFLYKMDSIMNGRKANERGGTQMEFFKSMCADDGAFVNTSRWDVDHSLPLIINTLKELSLTMHVGRGDKRGKTEAVFFPCAAHVRHTHTQKLTLSHTHTSSHSHAHVHAQMYAHTHTHTPTQPAPHLAPAPATSLSRKKAKKCISCSSLSTTFRRVFEMPATTKDALEAQKRGAHSCRWRSRTLHGSLRVSWIHHFK